jgi:hypothetical protein
MEKSIKINEKFDSFQEFYPLFEQYCIQNYCNFCRRDASYERNEDNQIVKINFIDFSCVHYSRTNKIRPLGKNCPFKLRFKWSKQNDCFFISRFYSSHENKHPVTKEYYEMYATNKPNNKRFETQKKFIHILNSLKPQQALIENPSNFTKSPGFTDSSIKINNLTKLGFNDLCNRLYQSILNRQQNINERISFLEYIIQLWQGNTDININVMITVNKMLKNTNIHQFNISHTLQPTQQPALQQTPQQTPQPALQLALQPTLQPTLQPQLITQNHSHDDNSNSHDLIQGSGQDLSQITIPNLIEPSSSLLQILSHLSELAASSLTTSTTTDLNSSFTTSPPLDLVPSTSSNSIPNHTPSACLNSSPSQSPNTSLNHIFIQQEKFFLNSVINEKAIKQLAKYSAYIICQKDMQKILIWSDKQFHIYEQMLKRNFKFTEFFDEDAIKILQENYFRYKVHNSRNTTLHDTNFIHFN